MTYPLARPDCLSKGVRVLPIIVAELKLGDVRREVLVADLVIGATTPCFKIDQKPSMVFV